MKFYGKIYCEEGVVKERAFDTKQEAVAYVLGSGDAIEVVDEDNDFYSTSTGTEAAVDPDDPAPTPEHPTTEEGEERERWINTIGAMGKEPMCQREGWDACNRIIGKPLRAQLAAAQEEVRKLKEEIEYLRMYGNKDCTAAADDALSRLRSGKEAVKEKCPPHSWDASGERCTKCGDKDWMT